MRPGEAACGARTEDGRRADASWMSCSWDSSLATALNLLGGGPSSDTNYAYMSVSRFTDMLPRVAVHKSSMKRFGPLPGSHPSEPAAGRAPGSPVRIPARGSAGDRASTRHRLGRSGVGGRRACRPACRSGCTCSRPATDQSARARRKALGRGSVVDGRSWTAARTRPMAGDLSMHALPTSARYEAPGPGESGSLGCTAMRPCALRTCGQSLRRHQARRWRCQAASPLA